MRAVQLPWTPPSLSIREKEDLILLLLDSLPRTSLNRIKNHIEPQLYVDIVGLLPNELALVALSLLSSKDLMSCRLVSRRWRTLADDYTLWKGLCAIKGWQWKEPALSRCQPALDASHNDTDDEGMGDEEEEAMIEPTPAFEDSGIALSATSVDSSSTSTPLATDLTIDSPNGFPSSLSRFDRSDVSSALPNPPPSNSVSETVVPDYKLLYATHSLLLRRFLTGSYRLSYLQSRGSPNSHTSTIYCLQLYTYPETGTQVLFTGSRDRTIREWDLSSGKVQRVISGVHEGSVLSLCAHDGLLASAGSDGRTVLYDLRNGVVKAIIQDHVDSVLCVRFDGQFLASCSKDRSIRVYKMPDLVPHLMLLGHRAAVNTIALSSSYLISASGDKSVRIWDIGTGREVQRFENHHSRGIASIDADYPQVLTGSSDQHIRLFDVRTEQGWSTSSRFDPQATLPISAPSLDEDASALSENTVCQICGSSPGASSERSDGVRREDCSHTDLVRSVAMNADFIISGSYDHRIKIWCRKTGRQVADLTGGHTGRVFCVDFDYTKVVSCGEDQQICIWSFAHGSVDTSFIPL